MGKACVIFCAGEVSGPVEIPAEALVIAADGGLARALALGIRPDVILGDFDSLGYVPEGENVLRYPVRKDDTDSMLAIYLGLERGCEEFFLYGALDGPRLDHAVANMQALWYLAEQGASGFLLGKDSAATVIKNGSLRFPAGAQGLVSVFCLGEKAEGVSLRGLAYPLREGELSGCMPLGVSNQFTGQAAEISVRAGSLLLIVPRSAGLPARG